MSYGTPLSLGEARGIADQIRQSTVVDREYWPWAIDEMVKRTLAAEAELAEYRTSFAQGDDAWAQMVVDRDAEIERLRSIVARLISEIPASRVIDISLQMYPLTYSE